MLNISNNSVAAFISKEKYKSLKMVEDRYSKRVIIRLLIVSSIVALIFMFIPWTQNIRANGEVTTLKPNQRPQTVHSIIAGRIEEWYVQEGDLVDKGDTLLRISEVKDSYFDPELLDRTQEQVTSQEGALISYENKVKSIGAQIEALKKTKTLKLLQAKNKLTQAILKAESDSVDFDAAVINFSIAERQYKRMEQLVAEGLKSTTDLENRRNKMQEANAKRISAQNKLLTSQNGVLNARAEIESIEAQYNDKITKAESDMYASSSSQFDAQAKLAKLKNQYKNYQVRSGFYFITAPQAGYVTEALQTGIGETIKEGTSLMSIMPSNYDLAVAMYVRPIDLPLLNKGQKVRIQFDGWPAIVFSGWPNNSIGTFGGKVYAIDNFISKNGMYRVLLEPNGNAPWPDALRVGSGTLNMVLLNDVPIWYELWRKINGFPPDYYENGKEEKKDAKG